MGIRRGPNILLDGLVFAVDPGNPSSYTPGGTKVTSLKDNLIGNAYNDVSGSMAENPRAWQFDQVDTSINFGNTSFIADSGSFTVAAWTNTDSISDINQYPGVFNKGDVSNGFILFQRRYSWGNYGKFTFYVNNRACTTTSIGGVGEWVYIVGTYDGDKGRIYFNGTYEAVTSSTIFKANDLDLIIGEGNSGASLGAGNNFYGKIGAVMMWNKALSAAEILQNYNALKGRFS